jgi:hypothetical protein
MRGDELIITNYERNTLSEGAQSEYIGSSFFKVHYPHTVPDAFSHPNPYHDRRVPLQRNPFD